MMKTSMATILQEAQVFIHANVVSNAAGNGAFRSSSLRGSYPFRVLHSSCQGPLALRFADSCSPVFSRKAVGDTSEDSLGSPAVLPSGEWPENFSILNFEDLSKHYESVIFKEEAQPATFLADVMSTTIYTARPKQRLEEIDHHFLQISGLPVINDNLECIGVLSKKDKAKATNGGCTDIDAGKDKLISPTFEVELLQNWCSDTLLPALISFPAILSFSGSAHAEVLNQQINQIYGDLGDGLEIGAQVLYLAALLGLVGVASYFVVRQVLIRRDLESAARDLQDRVRTGEAMPVEYFELGAVMLRKKFYPLASKYLEQAIAKWDGDPQDLAQVHNALGFSYVNDNLVDRGIAEYMKAVKLQPGYVVAWNNLGSAYEKKKNLRKALDAYEEALRFDPNNDVAKEYRDALKKRVERLEGIPVKNE